MLNHAHFTVYINYLCPSQNSTLKEDYAVQKY